MKEGTFIVVLATKGRKTGREHVVFLRAVSYNDRIYFSRRNQGADWLKNAIANPRVRVEVADTSYEGVASVVTDQTLAKKISDIKYAGESRAQESRIVLEVALCKTSLVAQHLSET